MSKIPFALVGIGQVARDQHIPVLANDPTFELVAAVSLDGQLAGLPSFPTIERMLASQPDVHAVAICTPPQVHYSIALDAIERGLHVMLEKPPCTTVAEVESLIDIAGRKQVALYAAWHSREAAAVEMAHRLLLDQSIHNVEVTWKEDVRELHAGQSWLWDAGGFGVFDPGINPLSIITKILPGRIELNSADLLFPSNCETPIAATLQLAGDGVVPIFVDLDFLARDSMVWEIAIDSDAGRLLLSKGGAALQLDSDVLVEAPDIEYANLHAEYAQMYARFATLVSEHRVDADIEPLRLVEDCLALGKRRVAAPFVE